MHRFNIRVYGVLINEQNQVLVSDEWIRGHYYTKFPGGGLEYGEGTRDCLRREFLEEMDLRVEVGDHLYTTDFFQQSAFHHGHQIISIYYYVKPLEPIKARISTKPFDFDDKQKATYERENECESFRFIKLDELSEDSVSLPIDKIVVGLLRETFN
jgi:8-oxo-dGTP diphosphatase